MENDEYDDDVEMARGRDCDESEELSDVDVTGMQARARPMKGRAWAIA